METGSSDHIALVGEMGVGKTTLGASLAEALDIPFLDSDRVLEGEDGRSSAEIAAEHGVAALHHRELDVLGSMVSSPRPAIIAPAASVVDSPTGRALLCRCTVVWLVAPDEVLEKRQAQGPHRRPVDAGERAGLRSRREPHLREIATCRVDTSLGSPPDVVMSILTELRARGVIPNRMANG